MALTISVFFLFFFTPNILERGVFPGEVSFQEETARVAFVIDGDTIVLENGEKVRYIGIDTPEYDFNETGASECFGRQARERNRELVQNKAVTLRRDVSDRDVYGRLLRYVYSGEVMVNKLLLEEGYADIMSIPPDTAHKNAFEEIREYARKVPLGLWKECYE